MVASGRPPVLNNSTATRHRRVPKVRFIPVTLICASPVMLLWDGLIMQGLLAGIIAVALGITAQTLRPGETEFLVSIFRPLAAVAAVPALWVVVQLLPLKLFAHPIWRSAETALGHPIAGAISVDPGASIIALGQYLCVIAVAFLSAAVAIERQRAEWILFALTAAVTAAALMLLARPATFARGQTIDCVAMGIIIAGAACIRTIERYETRRSSPQRSVPVLVWTFVACSAALAICGAAVTLATPEILIATGYGIFAFSCISIIRRFALGAIGITAISAPALGAAILLLAYYPAERGTSSVTLAFAGASNASRIALSERVLYDAPLVGTGAGTFAALAPIYRQIDDPPPDSTAVTAAATIAIELGEPMLWLITVATGGFIFILLRASLQRGRDSFYPAMGGSCLITLLLLSLNNAGLLGTESSSIAAAVIGLAIAQSKSRTAKL